MTRNRYIIYSLVLVLLAGVAVYRTAIGKDPSPPPKVEVELSREGANPGMLNDPGDGDMANRDFDGDDPNRVLYAYTDIRPIFTARCFPCHAKKEKVDERLHFYDYNSAQKLIEPGNLQSPIPASIAQGGSMKKHLSDQEANIIREWIVRGAKP